MFEVHVSIYLTVKEPMTRIERVSSFLPRRALPVELHWRVDVEFTKSEALFNIFDG